MAARWIRAAQAALVCLILLTELLPAFPDAPLTVAVVLSRELAPYRQALKGFEEVLKGSGRSYRLQEYNLEDAAQGAESLIARVRGRRPDLILTLGSTATSVIAEEIKDVPIVFSMVLPSSGAESLQELRDINGNLTGATMEIPLKTQFLKMREVLPTAKRVGVLYNPAVTGSLVEDAVQTAAALGLELVAIPITSETEVVSNAESLASKVDVLWSVADSTVFSPSGLRQILLVTLRSQIPFVGLSPSFVKAGALMAFSVDYEDVGRQSGEQTVRILLGEEPARVPLTIPRSVAISVNMNTARRIHVTIQDDVRRQAELFF